MAINIVALLHAGVRVDPSDPGIEKANKFYQDLLGLQNDVKRPEIPGIPGFWLNVRDGDRGQQVHVMGAEGESPVARSDKHDPTRNHIAFAVEDIDEARKTLSEKGVEFWVYEGLVGRSSDQVFFEDPFGNMIELQQAQ